MSQNLWSDEELILLEEIRPYLSTKEVISVFKELGHERTAEAISKKSRQLGVKFLDLGFPSLNSLSTEAKQSVLNTLQDREDFMTPFEFPEVLTPPEKARLTMSKRRFTVDLINELKEIRSSLPRNSSVSTFSQKSEKDSLVVVLSDNHIGRKSHDTQGKDKYSVDIGLERIANTHDLVLQSIGKNKIKDIDEVVLLLIGDHIDGEGIFPAHEMHLETHAAEQVKKTTKAFWGLIKQFKDTFGVCRVATTKGNHGRSGTSPESNWDNILFQQLELLVDLENDPELTIKNQYGDYNTVSVKGWKGLLRHRAYVQADTSAGIAKFAGWHGIHEWDFFAYGHYHHWGVMTWNGKPIFRNGSMMGGDDYAESLSYYDNPVQLCFTMNENELPACIYPIKYK